MRHVRLAMLGAVSVGVLASPAAARPASAAISDDWSTFQHDPLHGAVSPDASPGASNAAALTLQWKTFAGGSHGIVASPVVTFNSTLGESLVYEATQGVPAFVMAINAISGQPVWTQQLPKAVRSSPSVSGGTVYVADHDGKLYALNATTGAVVCSYATTGMIEASPVVGRVDATGDVVFVGDIGQGEKHNAGHEWAINGVGNSSGQCTLKWSFNSFGVTNGGTRTGSWSSPALAQDKHGRWLVAFGTTNPDDSVYVLDAVAGTQVWRFATTTSGDSDVGAGPTISPPGVNGFADGVVYVDGKNQVEYALDLVTGAPIWQFNLKKNAGSGAKAICTAALVGTNLICPYNKFVYDLNAVSGTLVWRSPAGASNFVASPAVSGAPGNQVVFAGDEGGTEHAFSLASGTPLLSAAGGFYIASSTAISGGRVFFGGVDGYVYAYG